MESEKKPDLIGKTSSLSHLELREEFMSEAQLSYFKNILIRRKQELIHEDSAFAGEIKETYVSPDPSDMATQGEVINLKLLKQEREGKLLKAIDESLQRVKEKEYGYCDACGIEINLRRLEISPTTHHCYDCQSLSELGGRTRPHY